MSIARARPLPCIGRSTKSHGEAKQLMLIETMSILAGALGLGAFHAFEVDHMTAVSTFVAQKPTPRQALSFGVKWAIGHGVTLLLLGVLLYGLKLTIAAPFAAMLERAVGLAIFALGAWTLYKLRRTSAISGHNHHQGSLWMGMLHGLAGTAAFVAESALILTQNVSLGTVVLFTTCFSIGVLMAMGLYAALLGGMLHFGQHRWHSLARSAQFVTGLVACCVGIYWVVG